MSLCSRPLKPTNPRLVLVSSSSSLSSPTFFTVVVPTICSLPVQLVLQDIDVSSKPLELLFRFLGCDSLQVKSVVLDSILHVLLHRPAMRDIFRLMHGFERGLDVVKQNAHVDITCAVLRLFMVAWYCGKNKVYMQKHRVFELVSDTLPSLLASSGDSPVLMRCIVEMCLYDGSVKLARIEASSYEVEEFSSTGGITSTTPDATILENAQESPKDIDSPTHCQQINHSIHRTRVLNPSVLNLVFANLSIINMNALIHFFTLLNILLMSEDAGLNARGFAQRGTIGLVLGLLKRDSFGEDLVLEGDIVQGSIYKTPKREQGDNTPILDQPVDNTQIPANLPIPRKDQSTIQNLHSLVEHFIVLTARQDADPLILDSLLQLCQHPSFLEAGLRMLSRISAYSKQTVPSLHLRANPTHTDKHPRWVSVHGLGETKTWPPANTGYTLAQWVRFQAHDTDVELLLFSLANSSLLLRVTLDLVQGSMCNRVVRVRTCGSTPPGAYKSIQKAAPCLVGLDERVLAPDQWHLVVLTHKLEKSMLHASSGKLVMYLDGEKIGTSPREFPYPHKHPHEGVHGKLGWDEYSSTFRRSVVDWECGPLILAEGICSLNTRTALYLHGPGYKGLLQQTSSSYKDKFSLGVATLQRLLGLNPKISVQTVLQRLGLPSGDWVDVYAAVREVVEKARLSTVVIHLLPSRCFSLKDGTEMFRASRLVEGHVQGQLKNTHVLLPRRVQDALLPLGGVKLASLNQQVFFLDTPSISRLLLFIGHCLYAHEQQRFLWARHEGWRTLAWVIHHLYNFDKYSRGGVVVEALLGTCCSVHGGSPLVVDPEALSVLLLNHEVWGMDPLVALQALCGLVETSNIHHEFNYSYLASYDVIAWTLNTMLQEVLANKPRSKNLDAAQCLLEALLEEAPVDCTRHVLDCVLFTLHPGAIQGLHQSTSAMSSPIVHEDDLVQGLRVRLLEVVLHAANFEVVAQVCSQDLFICLLSAGEKNTRVLMFELLEAVLLYGGSRWASRFVQDGGFRNISQCLDDIVMDDEYLVHLVRIVFGVSPLRSYSRGCVHVHDLQSDSPSEEPTNQEPTSVEAQLAQLLDTTFSVPPPWFLKAMEPLLHAISLRKGNSLNALLVLLLERAASQSQDIARLLSQPACIEMLMAEQPLLFLDCVCVLVDLSFSSPHTSSTALLRSIFEQPCNADFRSALFSKLVDFTLVPMLKQAKGDGLYASVAAFVVLMVHETGYFDCKQVFKLGVFACSHLGVHGRPVFLALRRLALYHLSRDPVHFLGLLQQHMVWLLASPLDSDREETCLFVGCVMYLLIPTLLGNNRAHKTSVVAVWEVIYESHSHLVQGFFQGTRTDLRESLVESGEMQNEIDLLLVGKSPEEFCFQVEIVKLVRQATHKMWLQEVDRSRLCGVSLSGGTNLNGPHTKTKSGLLGFFSHKFGHSSSMDKHACVRVDVQALLTSLLDQLTSHFKLWRTVMWEDMVRGRRAYQSLMEAFRGVDSHYFKLSDFEGPSRQRSRLVPNHGFQATYNLPSNLPLRVGEMCKDAWVTLSKRKQEGKGLLRESTSISLLKEGATLLGEDSRLLSEGDNPTGTTSLLEEPKYIPPHPTRDQRIETMDILDMSHISYEEEELALDHKHLERIQSEFSPEHRNEVPSCRLNCFKVQGLEKHAGICLTLKDAFYVVLDYQISESGEIEGSRADAPASFHAHYTSEDKSHVSSLETTDPLEFYLTDNVLRVDFDAITEIHRRRYCFREVGLEFFLTNGSNFLLVFPQGRERLYAHLLRETLVNSVVHHSVDMQHRARSNSTLHSLLDVWDPVQDAGVQAMGARQADQLRVPHVLEHLIRPLLQRHQPVPRLPLGAHRLHFLESRPGRSQNL